MFLGEERTISKAKILEKVSEYDIYRYYLGFDFKVKKTYCSPLREGDRNPSFGIFVSRSGELLYKDFGSNCCGDCIKFVGKLLNIDYFSALRRIDLDLGLGINGARKDYEKIIKAFKRPKIISGDLPTQIQITPRPFSHSDLSYWEAYGIDKTDLYTESIYAVKHLYINKKQVPVSELTFAYYYKDHSGADYLKIYSPQAIKYKWVSNVPVKASLGLSSLPKVSDTIIIAKSKKDKIVLKKLLSDVYEVQKEGPEVITPEIDQYFNDHYKQKICFFDNDLAGIQASKALNQLGYGWINIPGSYTLEGIKDPSDLVKAYGYDALSGLLKSKNIL